MKIILASQSPRRKFLLKKIISEFDIIISDIDETIEKPNQKVNIIVEFLAKLKAEAVFEIVKKKYNDNFIIIGADTIVTLNNIIYGKPTDRNNAIEIIKELSGKTHQVITGIAVISYKNNIKNIFTDNESSDVKIKKLNDNEIAEYANKSDCLDKAGAYAIQKMKSFSEKEHTIFDIVDSYSGDYDNIVGLPINLLNKLLIEKELLN